MNSRSNLPPAIKTHAHGFTLIEMLVAVTIIGILASIAYPSYTAHLIRVRRIDGQSGLLDLAARLERFYYQNNTYSGASFEKLGSHPASQQGYYRFQITGQTATGYDLAAVPVGSQLKYDTECGALTYDQMNTRGQTGGGSLRECWG